MPQINENERVKHRHGVMSHIFISHSTKDGATEANQLVAALEAAGLRCWIAPRDVIAGMAYPGQIVRAIREGHALVLLLTHQANQSPDVAQEVQRAHSEGKLIVPLIVHGIQASDDLSYFLDVRQHITWAGAKETAAALEAVFASTGGPAQQAETEWQAARSLTGDKAAAVNFVNNTHVAVEVLWKDYQGEEHLYNTLQPGQSYRQSTYMTHPWIVRNAATHEVLAFLIASAEEQTLSVADPTFDGSRPGKR